MVKSGRRAIVVGAGVGGVAIAARLAKAGFNVTVLEKNSFTGGRCSLIHEQGYRFDQGPSLLLLPELFHETFADLGTSFEAEGVRLVKCEPNYMVHFDDGETVTLSSDLSVMKEQLERWEGVDGFDRYLKFLQEAHLHYEVSMEHVLHKNFTSYFSLLRPAFLRKIFALHPFESVYTRVSKYFYTERLRRVFTFSSMYMGMSPYDAPGTYSLLQYAEIARSIWYPIGGFHKVVDALVKIGTRSGVDYKMSSPVGSINLSPDGKRTTGVTLSSGEVIESDLVVINADLVYAYNNLLPPTPYGRALSKRPASCSSISFYWALDRVVPQLKTHNIFLAGDYRASFDAIFKEQRLPQEPSFYVNVPSRADPTAAPEGKDAVIVLLPVGHLVDSNGDGIGTINWAEVIERARELVFRTIEARIGVKGLRNMVAKEIVNTPVTWKDKFNLDKGGILGLSHSFLNVMSFRPTTAHPSIADCYFVGASTHPGTGVPICLAGAKITADQILAREGLVSPWAPYDHAGRMVASTSPLDVRQTGTHLVVFVGLALLAILFVSIR